VVAGCRGTADQRCTVIYEELAEGQLRELEPQPLPAEMPSEPRVHSVAFRFNPARYLRFCSRVLTASRAAIRWRAFTRRGRSGQLPLAELRPNAPVSATWAWARDIVRVAAAANGHAADPPVNSNRPPSRVGLGGPEGCCDDYWTRMPPCSPCTSMCPSATSRIGAA